MGCERGPYAVSFVNPSQQTAQINTVPSPIGGLNVYDNLAAMPPTDAIALNNLIPQPFGCQVRKGYQVYASGMPESVNTIAYWSDVDGSYSAFAWSADGLYDITVPGAVGAPILTGLSTSWWQVVGFANSAGSHLLAFSGGDDPILYNSAGVQRLTAGDGVAINTIKGVDPSELIQATVHQRRVWAVQKDTAVGWYWPTDSIYGELFPFDFGPLFKRGGYLVALATWTVDSGEGSQDHLVAISSNGEAAVYGGTDVTDETTWKLQGVYYVGAPIRGRRFYANVAGDLFLLTTVGVVSLATVLTSTQVNVSSNTVYSKKVQYLLADLTNDLKDLDGWQMIFVPSFNFLFINAPTVFSGGAGQLVANHINGAWCSFSGYKANCWSVIDGSPYFGDNEGRVLRALVGDKDNVNTDGSGGTNIYSFVRQAYSYVGAPAAQKQIGMYRPNFLNTRKVAYSSTISYDFESPQLNEPTGSAAKSAAALWGEAIWGTDKWSGGVISQREWRQAIGVGNAASISMRISSEAETIWVSTDFSFKVGGVL